MPSPVDHAMAFYVRLFTFYGIQLRPAAAQNQFRWKVFNLLSWIFVFAEIYVLLDFGSQINYIRRTRKKVVAQTDIITIVILYSALLPLSHIYLWWATKKMDISRAIEFIIKNGSSSSSSSSSGGKNNNNNKVQLNEHGYKCLIFNAIVCYVVLATTLIWCLSFALAIKYSGLDTIKVLSVIPIMLCFVIMGFLQTHSCLFFALLMELLTDSLARTRELKAGELSSEVTRNYGKVRELARTVNDVFSPLLAFTCVTNLAVFALITALPAYWVIVTGVVILPSVFPNFIACVMCLNSVIKCNQNRLRFVFKMIKSLNRVNKYSVKSMTRLLDFNCWLIDIMLNDEDFFNIARYVPMDETIFLMVFQNVFDMRMALVTKYDLTNFSEEKYYIMGKEIEY